MVIGWSDLINIALFDLTHRPYGRNSNLKHGDVDAVFEDEVEIEKDGIYPST